MKMKLLRDAMLSNDDKHATKAGTVIEATPAQAEHLRANGIAERARPEDIAKAEARAEARSEPAAATKK